MRAVRVFVLIVGLAVAAVPAAASSGPAGSVSVLADGADGTHPCPCNMTWDGVTCV